MNLRALKTLVEIDRGGGFAAVAARLGLTVSAVSLQMKTLEAALQLSLLDRAHRPPRLTPSGRRVARHAAAVLREAEAIERIAADGAGLHGEYRIGFVGTAAVRLAPRFLAQARQRHPEARITLSIDVSAALAEAVAAGALDAAVATLTPDLPDRLIHRPIAAEPFALAAPRGAVDSAAPSLAVCAASLPLVQFTPTTGIGLLAAQHLDELGLAPAETIVTPSVEAVMECVNLGIGFAILPEPDAKRYADPARAAIAPLGLTRVLCLAMRPTAPIAAHIDAFAELFDPA